VTFVTGHGQEGESRVNWEALARVGATGDAVAPQVHFEVRKLNQAGDTMRYLAGSSGATGAVLPGRP